MTGQEVVGEPGLGMMELKEGYLLATDVFQRQARWQSERFSSINACDLMPASPETPHLTTRLLYHPSCISRV
jgi:hypothetical protein